MDLRKPVLAIICGGSLAPGMNGVISSVTLEGRNQGASVIGFCDGFENLVEGKAEVVSLSIKDVTRIHDLGGCILRTSNRQLDNDKEVDNCLRVLEHRRVRYLVAVGGTETARSVYKIAKAAKAANIKLSIVHVPKTIYNELLLPSDARTFGFGTARQVGAEVVQQLQVDSRSVKRWYVIIAPGMRAGHLALGIAKASSATLCLIPEDFTGRSLSFAELCDIVEGSIYKRAAFGKAYGVAVLAEGLVDLLPPEELKTMFGSHSSGHTNFSFAMAQELNTRLKMNSVVGHTLGSELRGATPNADDCILARDLGFAATRFLLEGSTDCMITLKGGTVLAIPLASIIDQKSGVAKVRWVDKTGISYQVAQNYMIKLQPTDLQDAVFLAKMLKVSGMTRQNFVARFSKVSLGL